MRILVCPICKSKEIELDAGGYTGKYHCKNCGYIGSLILEMSEEEYEKLREEVSGENEGS
ncbi:TFIIB-type zinc ribbon-containing protein [Archaeoglobales archaeon]|nr:MAG: TFIIB-type zinc ribbon-containing protein [Archaeoglobales archaeon]HDN73457.1 TFIIB-type zinc ribbon-containing protein [Archaeoglobus sp.]